MRCAVFHKLGEPNRETFTNSIEQVLQYNGQVTFDGVYQSVWEYRDYLPPDTILFMAGDTEGTTGFVDRQQLLTLADEYGCLIGWHTYTHRDLTKLSDDDIRRELAAPAWYPRTYFAYPYGEYDDRVIELVKEAGYQKAYSTTQGNDDQYSIHREYL